MLFQKAHSFRPEQSSVRRDEKIRSDRCPAIPSKFQAHGFSAIHRMLHLIVSDKRLAPEKMDSKIALARERSIPVERSNSVCKVPYGRFNHRLRHMLDAEAIVATARKTATAPQVACSSHKQNSRGMLVQMLLRPGLRVEKM